MKYTKELLQEAVNRSTCVSGVLRYLGKEKINGGTHGHVSKKIKEFGIDTSHFKKVKRGGITWEKGKHPTKKTYSEILVYDRRNGIRELSSRLRRAFLESGADYLCYSCGITHWMGKEITLEIDHIDGDSLNNLVSNLRFLCPNCHSLTDTYKSKNIGGS